MKVSAKIGYGVGQLSDGAKQAAFNTFLFFYYNQVLGLSGSLAGTAALLALVADAITDPMIGQISDRFRSRWGRRHPFMLAGALPFGLAMYLLFSPPEGLSEYGLFGWMLGTAIAVRMMLTLFFVPHLSLGAELVKDYHGRTSLIGYRVFFTYAGILFCSVTGFSVFFPPTEAFPNGMLNASSYPKFGLFCGVVGSMAMLWTVMATRKAIPDLQQPSLKPAAHHPLLAFLQVFKSLRLKSFRVLFSVTLLINTFAGIIQTLLVYVAIYVFEFQPEHLAVLAASVVIGILFASTAAQGLSRRLDKRGALTACVLIASVFAFTPISLFLVGILQTLEASHKLLLVFTLNGISQIFFIAYVILLDSMLSDIIDENELNTAKREEGAFFAARSFATKASYGLGSFFAGIGLDIIRFPQAASPENIPPGAVTNLAILAGPVMFLMFVSTILISRHYPLTQQRHREISAAIKAKSLSAPEIGGVVTADTGRLKVTE
jgi:glycoside/pentoside/hexuronide:cation symporter, GPH family